MNEFNDDQKKKVEFIVQRILEYKGFFSDLEIYSAVAQHLNIRNEFVATPTLSELERMVESGKIAKYSLNHPKDAKVDAEVNQKTPNFYYFKLLK